MDVRQILGERIRRRRMALGLNQTAFADTVGIPVPTLSSIEHHSPQAFRLRDRALIRECDLN